MQCRVGSPGRGASLTAKAVVGAPKQWSLAANASRDIALAGESERQRSLLQAARWEHSESTGTARRALKVVNDTTELAARTLDQLFQQGQQVDRATHGVDQIDVQVQHTNRIIAFMGRWCCLRTDKHDTDLEAEKISRSQVVQRQQMDCVLATECIATGYVGKHELLAAAMTKCGAAGPAADAAAAAASSSAADAVASQPWSELIAAVPGPLGRERAAGRGSMPMLGHGLEERQRQLLQAETARQDCYLDQVCSGLDALRTMGLAMGEELAEQDGKLDALQQRADQTGQGLRSAAAGAAKLVGRAPRRASSASSWQHGQDGGMQAVSRAMVAAAPMARYRKR
ncbi:hypothetical protein D9Q98_009656 [Chlorella vulgaris]|uniref:t-SNARE coiled-coil homology domain-containing protein n=1 Tax=Chlorella vulgaris TaxID=3077 RepID=A0A9D4TER8_CHLVU|nr:hypothetical protein D9Q98_009656 [Chlorella vulgaris]